MYTLPFNYLSIYRA